MQGGRPMRGLSRVLLTGALISTALVWARPAVAAEGGVGVWMEGPDGSPWSRADPSQDFTLSVGTYMWPAPAPVPVPLEITVPATGRPPPPRGAGSHRLHGDGDPDHVPQRRERRVHVRLPAPIGALSRVLHGDRGPGGDDLPTRVGRPSSSVGPSQAREPTGGPSPTGTVPQPPSAAPEQASRRRVVPRSTRRWSPASRGASPAMPCSTGRPRANSSTSRSTSRTSI